MCRVMFTLSTSLSHAGRSVRALPRGARADRTRYGELSRGQARWRLRAGGYDQPMTSGGRRSQRFAVATAVAAGLVLGLGACGRDTGNPISATPTEESASADPTLPALQAALDGEYAATYAYGVIGGRLTNPAQQSAALAALASHDDMRDRLRTDITALGGQPGVPAPAYRLPFQVHTAAQARSLAVEVETKLAGLWQQVSVHATGASQQSAAAAADCLQRAAKWSKLGG